MLRTQERPTNNTPTRACQNCSKAKAKCEPKDNSSDIRCARCFRLDKECIVPPRVKRKRRPPNASTNVALEQKIESLVSLLSAAQGITSKPEQLTPPESEPQSEPSPSSSNRQSNEAATTLDGLSWAPASHSCKSAWESSNQLPNQQSPHLVAPPQPSPSLSHLIQNRCSDSRNLSQVHDARRLLNVYQEQFAPHFPFISIPDCVSAEDLHRQKPWLYKTILMVAAQEERTRQQELGKQIVSDITCAMLLRGEKTLDMLQSLIVCNLWAYYFTSIAPSSQSSAIFQLALALLFDLGLNRPVRGDDGPGEVLPDFTKGSVDRKQEITRSSDERRALLSCYLFGSVAMLYVKRHEGLQYSPYIEYTCQVLEEASEQVSDLVLVSLVRMQCIVDSTYKSLPIKFTAEDIKAPAWMHGKAARCQLEKYWASLRTDIQQNALVQMSFHDSNVFIFGLSFHKYHCPSETGSSHSLDMLYSCLLSCQTLLNEFVDMPVSAYLSFSIMDLAHMGHTCSTLLKLSLIEEPGWELAHVRQTVNVQYYFDQIASKFIQAGNAIDQIQNRICSESFPTGCGRAILKVKGWYEARICSEEIQDPPLSQNETNAMGMGMGDILSVDQMMLDDADWVEFVMGNCKYWP